MIGEIFTAVGSYITVKEVLGPAIGGGLGYMAALTRSRSDAKLKAAELKEHAEEVAKAQHTASEASQIDSFVKREASQSENLTQRFKLLMDGYEAQITFLTTQVQTLRREVATFSEKLDAHRKVCAGCPHFRSRETDGPSA